MLMRSRTLAISTMCTVAAILLGGCATPSMRMVSNSSGDPTTADESWMACGATLFLERGAEAMKPTRAEAIQLDLEWHKEAIRSHTEVTSKVPLERYVELFEAALSSLPEAEREIADDALLRLNVASDDLALGMVELSVNFKGEYYVSELVFSPRHPELCTEVPN